jgi:hypothetical protein
MNGLTLMPASSELLRCATYPITDLENCEGREGYARQRSGVNKAEKSSSYFSAPAHGLRFTRCSPFWCQFGPKTPWRWMIHDDLSHHESSIFADDSFCWVS